MQTCRWNACSARLSANNASIASRQPRSVLCAKTGQGHCAEAKAGNTGEEGSRVEVTAFGFVALYTFRHSGTAGRVLPLQKHASTCSCARPYIATSTQLHVRRHCRRRAAEVLGGMGPAGATIALPCLAHELFRSVHESPISSSHNHTLHQAISMICPSTWPW